MSHIIIGIDPGQSGGIAFLAHPRVDANKMPATERDVYDLLQPWAGVCDKAYIEQVGAFPGQGVASSFKFGTNYGMLRAFLIALGIPFETVAPGVWQREMRCITKKGMTKTQHKNQLKARSQELFPQLKVTLATADALLIAEFGRRKERG